MKKLAVLFVACSLGSACVLPEDGVNEAREALPAASAMQVKLPGGDMARLADDGRPGVASDAKAVLGQTADFYAFTRTISGSLNLGAGFVLLLAHSVVQHRPTSIEGDTFIWGPWTDSLNPAEWRMTVRKTAQGDFAWTFEGRRKNDPGAAYQAVVAGLATPGTPHRGSGSFSIDFDVAEALDPVGNQGVGVIDITYDLESDPAWITMDYATMAEQPGGGQAPATFHYEYAEHRDGHGDFQFSLSADLDEDGSAWELADVRSRWLPTGAGRADVKITGGDLLDLTVLGTECWDTSFGRVYWTDSAGWQPTEGDATACAFEESLLPSP